MNGIKNKYVKIIQNYMKIKSVFAVAVGNGREKTFDKFVHFAKLYAPEVEIVAHFDKKDEGCGVIRHYLFEELKSKYDIVIMIDDDMEITEGWYTEVLEAYNTFKDVNLFTTRINQDDSIYTIGADIVFQGNHVLLMHKGDMTRRERFEEVEWAPGGCMIYCRKALKTLKPIKIPICEELDMYGQWKKNNLGKVIALSNAILIHNVKDNPRVTKFRTPENMLISSKMLYDKHGFTFMGDDRTFKFHCGITEEEQLKPLMNEANKYIKKYDNKDVTYLMPRASDEILFNISRENINRYTPAPILTCGRDVTNHWSEAFRWLFSHCQTDIGVFIDDDAIILRDISPLIELVRSGHGLVGFTSRGETNHTKYGYFQPNFMIMNIKKFKEEFGEQGIDVDVEQAKRELNITTNPEFCYGISQKLRGRPSKDLSMKLSEHYKFASVISDGDMPYVLHLWYGAWRHRRSPEGDMSERDALVSRDFWNSKLKI